MPSIETATERVITLMTPTEKATLEQKARQAGVSVGEFVRRSVDAYDPEEAALLAELEALAVELKRSNDEASSALDRALASIAETRAQLDRSAA
ncbi:hypothetical protein HL658_31875 [Azospirillum sp. RWY-5-1]|uniref:Ribbon-helix-helix protein CopG domain-containing protein n=1 Tax=Azospirillum oleiclasticum TaxID=2735135 RepID=A0ABX2TG29_9PROT|nr:hypothetical protein [Azospirillum oleiclasticum]NYZ17167.1 hypothetical protein [Azospirillum oleiclasticum]NYZ23124.1 hypothetical protein [Azospirillum oleiclasticum]